jgi:hypothetical protein
VVEKNIEPKIEKTGTEASASSLSSKKVCVDDSKKQSSGFGVLLSKRKFESDNKVRLLYSVRIVLHIEICKHRYQLITLLIC